MVLGEIAGYGSKLLYHFNAAASNKSNKEQFIKWSQLVTNLYKNVTYKLERITESLGIFPYKSKTRTKESTVWHEYVWVLRQVNMSNKQKCTSTLLLTEKHETEIGRHKRI